MEAEMDQQEIVLYTKGRCLYCWRTKRLLRHKDYVIGLVRGEV